MGMDLYQISGKEYGLEYIVMYHLLGSSLPRQDMSMPPLSSKRTVVCVPTRACSRELGAIDHILNIEPVTQPKWHNQLAVPHRNP